MKNKSAFAILLIGMTACSVNEIEQEINPVLDTIEAYTPEPDTKVHLAEGNYVHWTSGDQISVFDNYNNNNRYTLTSGENSGIGYFSCSFEKETKVAALYPYMEKNSCDLSNKKLTIYMPSEYVYSETEINKAPMAGIITEQSEPIRFQNAGALMKLIVKNVPTGYSKAVLKSKTDALADYCNITFDQNNVPTLTANAKSTAKEITINFDALQTSKDMTFWFPIPVGTYDGLTLTLESETKETIVVIDNKALTSSRNMIYRKEVTLEDTNTIKVSTPAELTQAITDAEESATIKLTDNISISEKLIINNDITLDLNGMTLSYTSVTAGDKMITNNGTLTIKDSSTDGKITYSYTGEADTSHGKGNYTIFNYGTLVLESGIIENTTAKMSHASYAIHTDAGATLTINDGKVLNLNADAVRMADFGNGTNNMTVNGGYIEGLRAIFMQLTGNNTASAPIMNLDINGGSLVSIDTSDNGVALYVYSHGESGDNVQIDITDGIFGNNIFVYNTSCSVNISGGTFNGYYGIYDFGWNDESIQKGTYNITGGRFTKEWGAYYIEEYNNAKDVEYVEDGEYVTVKKKTT